MPNRIWYLNGTGTPTTNSRCDTCRSALQTTGPHGSHTWCGAAQQRMPQPITTCSQYVDSRHPTVEELSAGAWLLTPDGNGDLIVQLPGQDCSHNDDAEPPDTVVQGFAPVDAIGQPLVMSDEDEDDVD
jgi:hypothetical protein